MSVLLWNYCSNNSINSKNAPPGPTPLPLIGNLLQILVTKGDPFLDGIAQLARRYGEVMRLKLPILGDCCVVTNPHLVYELQSKFSDALNTRVLDTYSLRESTDFGKDLLLSNGEVWRHSRKIFLLGLSKNMKRSPGIIMNHLSALVERLQKDYQNKDVPIYLEMSKTSLDVIIELTSGGAPPTKEMRDEFVKCSLEIEKYCDALHPRNLFPILERFPKYEDHFRKVVKRRNEVLQKTVQQHLETKQEENRDLFDELIELQRMGEIDEATMRQIVLDFYNGAQDTVSITLSVMLGYLALNQDFQARLHDEIDKIVGDGFPSVHDQEKLVLLDAAIKEAMRLSTVAPFSARYLTRSIEARGFKIPAGTQILFHWYTMARDERLWKDPSSFNPDRFLHEDEGMRLRGSELPADPSHFKLSGFGIGKRSCAGIQLAKFELFLASAFLVQKFHWDVSPQHSLDLRIKMGFLGKPTKPVILRARPRY
jgi:cytochrome P450